MEKLRWAVVPAWLIDEYLPKMDASTIKVYLYLARWAGKDGKLWHSHERIAKGCGISKSSVIRSIATLESMGAIAKIVRSKPGKRVSNLYSLGTIGRDQVSPMTPAEVVKQVSSMKPKQVSPMTPKVTTREVTKEQTTPTPTGGPVFQAFWDAYPKKEKMIEAQRAFASAITDGVSPEYLIKQAQGFARKVAIEKTESRWIPLPNNWLGQKRYLDEYPPALSVGPRYGPSYIEE